jgi:hypothetical protein
MSIDLITAMNAFLSNMLPLNHTLVTLSSDSSKILWGIEDTEHLFDYPCEEDHKQKGLDMSILSTKRAFPRRTPPSPATALVVWAEKWGDIIRLPR